MDYDGGEDQPIDPLIGSIEGLNNTPAYRGLALAVFENLELADYGNRIPFLTFEVVADTANPSLGSILADASQGRIHCADARTVIGYAALGRTITSSVMPLLDCFDVPLFDDGSLLRSPTDVPAAPPEPEDLGATVTGQAEARFEREQTTARDFPAVLSLSYYDLARDYQTGLARTSVWDQLGNDVPAELPAVLEAGDARSLVEAMIGRKWARRDKLKMRLPPKYMTLEPGATMLLDLSPGSWEVLSCTIEGLTAVVELQPVWNPSAVIAADGGRSSKGPDVVATPVTLAAIEMADPAGEHAARPALFLAASSAGPSWRAVPVEVSVGGFSRTIRTSRKKALLGNAMTKLATGEPGLSDGDDSVEVQLIDDDQWLISCDDGALAAGLNLAMLGDELIQFGIVEPLGPGRFRLRRLVRGRQGTEWAISKHAIGETFVMIDLQTLESIQLPSWIDRSSVSFAHKAQLD